MFSFHVLSRMQLATITDVCWQWNAPASGSLKAGLLQSTKFPIEPRLVKYIEVLMSDHNVHKKSQTVTLLSLHWCLAVHDPTACRRRERAYVLVRQCLIGCIAGSIPGKKDKGQHTEHSTKSKLETYDSYWGPLSFSWVKYVYIILKHLNWLSYAADLKQPRISNRLSLFAGLPQTPLVFAMLRWILVPLTVAMSDDAECDSPGMMQLKGIPSHQGNQPPSHRKFTPDVWAPKFETSNNGTSTLQMACQGVAWFTLASPTL